MVDAIGFLAATLTTLSFVPQVRKVYATRSAGDLSVLTFTALTVGVVCWLLYGLLMGAAPIIIANIVTLGLLLAILVGAVRYRRTASAESAPRS